METTKTIKELKMDESIVILKEEENKNITGGKNRREAELESESCACECG